MECRLLLNLVVFNYLEYLLNKNTKEYHFLICRCDMPLTSIVYYCSMCTPKINFKQLLRT